MDEKLDELDEGLSEGLKKKHIYKMTQMLISGQLRPFIDQEFVKLDEN